MAERRKISIWATTTGAYRLGWDCLVALREATVIAIVLELGVALLRPVPTLAQATWDLILLLIMGVIPAVLLAPYAVMIHRRILLRDENRNYVAASTAPHTVQFAIAAALLAAAGTLGGIILTAAAVLGWGAAVLGFVVMIAAAFVSVRVLLAFPAIATDASSTPFADSWQTTRGSFWHIFWTLVLAVIPVMVLSVALGWVMSLGGVGWLVGTVGNAAVAAFIFALFVALASHLYQTRAAWMQDAA